MNTISIIISLIALVGAGFAFLRASTSHRMLGKRIEQLKEKNTLLEQRLRRLEGGNSRSKRPTDETSESGRRNKPRQEEQEQTREPRQRQRDRQPRENQPQERQPRENQPKERQQDRKSQREDETQPGEPRRKKENRRRNEPMDRKRNDETGQSEQQRPASKPVNLEIVGGDLLEELEQAASGQQTTTANQVTQPEPEHSGKKYAIIPEDGVIRQHQLQQQPDSDSYIEVDAPTEGSNRTRYRFNLSGNHAFVISQGIDRLENAFAFEKPSNRMVSQVVLQGDGVLSRVGNGWKIEEKARIDFR
ncbi:hypothetical protein H9Q13_04275 [Pontibacter sp. JH31]|uniref:Uncharacterized protein n=1 Tax=Pontibacter aquaedesilientis TaxID=2766980 RepID=A0ABR7XDJ7_9BACT|nr:hypothetical protein [Pontibacter aquaedesilientis]MBD1396370.1 hypothetical protein [Pontibacter aquaedesilientis]